MSILTPEQIGQVVEDALRDKYLDLDRTGYDDEPTGEDLGQTLAAYAEVVEALATCDRQTDDPPQPGYVSHVPDEIIIRARQLRGKA